MAASRTSSFRKPGVATLIWLAFAVMLAVASAILLWKLMFGADYRAQALEDVQRIEFELAYDENGNAQPQNLEGRTLTLETALAMAETAEVTATPDEAALLESYADEAIAEETLEVQDAVDAAVAEAMQPEENAPPAATSPPVPAQPAPTEPVTEQVPMVEEAPAPSIEAPAPAAPDSPAAPDAPAAPDSPASPTISGDAAETLAPVEMQAENGILPVIAKDGTKPWRYFARTGDAPAAGKPRIAIVLSGLGLSRLSTEAAIHLPPQVTLAFSPYGRELTASASEQAREAGHEIMLDLPMQTDQYPAVDPGPYGIRADLSPAENDSRLQTVLTKSRGYIGLLGAVHDVVTEKKPLTAPLIDGISSRGLLFINAHSRAPAGMFRVGQRAGVPLLYANLVLDERMDETFILNQLAQAEDVARNKGQALLIGHSYPITIEMLDQWTRGLEAKGFALVPVSALGGS